MTGIIVFLSADRLSGTILGEDGVRVRFNSDAVVAHDVMRLEAGKAVIFDLSAHQRSWAVNVSLQHVPNAQPGKSRELPMLRYMGFEQAEGVREYHFQRILPGEVAAHFIVTGEVALFTRHRVALQEGPSLCLVRLNAELDRATGATVPGPVVQCCLGERDMLQYLDTRQEAAKHRGPRHGPQRRAATQA